MKSYIIYPSDSSLSGKVKGYLSFSRLCKEEGLNRDVLKKDHLPVKLPTGEIIVEIEIDERL